MSTTMPKPGEIKRVWYILDAADRPLGRTATVAASILRGKHKVTFTPHVDCGDHVIILNVDKAVLTGNKLEQKKYQRHTGYVGGLKETKYKDLMEKRPELAMKLAVKRMLPATVIGRKSLTRLRLFKGTEHTHAAQKPIVWAGK
jgi:large subunit ribosomal protein L13